MKLLAVETSGQQCSIALCDERQVLCVRGLQTEGRRHAQMLVADVRAALTELHWSPSQIDAVAVSAGPGSFTGLRVGIVFAKTFAWANQTKLVAVDTLQAIAQLVPATIPEITVISDAQRGELFTNTYSLVRTSGERTSEDASTALLRRMPLSEVRILKPDELPQSGYVTGPAIPRFSPLLPPGLIHVDQSLWQPTAATVAVIGRDLFVSQQFSDPDLLEPVYLRRSYAEEKQGR